MNIDEIDGLDLNAPETSDDDKKALLEHHMDQVLAAWEKAGIQPLDFSRYNMRDAIGAAAAGLYALSGACLANSIAQNVATDPWPNKTSKPADLDQLTVADLRKGLAWLRRQPTAKRPWFR